MEYQTWNIRIITGVPADESEAVFNCGGGDEEIKGAMVDRMAVLTQFVSDRSRSFGDLPSDHIYAGASHETLKPDHRLRFTSFA